MAIAQRHINYPVSTVILSNLHSIILYVAGALILFHAGWVYGALYILYVLSLEIRLIRNHCVNCFYWGKTCGFGKGRLSALIFKQGDPKHFCSKSYTFYDLIPDMLVALIPVITGIVLLVIHFKILILTAVLLIVLLTTKGNEFIRRNMVCKYCKQKDLGCPAEQLFKK